jgi:hypothetical protein
MTLSMSEEARHLTRGSVIKGYARYVKHKWGQSGVLACQKAIGLEGFKVHNDAWYPEDINGKILRWIADNYGEEHVEKAAAFTITERGIIAFAARMAGIDKVLERGEEDYRRNFNFGELRVEKREKEAMIRLIDSTSNELDCLSWRGAFKGVLQLTNKDGEVREIDCTHKNPDADCCLFKMTWE